MRMGDGLRAILNREEKPVNLSKSRYVKGMQCPKMLWMDRYMPDEFDKSVMNEAVLEAGNMIGDFAMGYFGEFTEVSFSKNTTDMITETQRLIDAGVRIIAEASFAHKNNFCSADILRRNSDGSFDLVEVKASSNTDEDTKSSENGSKFAIQYLHDMAYQYYVITNAGYRINRVFLMQINKNYIRNGELDISQFFVLNEATEKVLALQEDIPANITGIISIAEQSDEPEDFIGSRCNKPYPCGYKKYCWRDMPKNNIYDIGFRMRSSKKDDFYQNGIVTFEDVANAGIDLSMAQARQINTELYDLPAYVDKEGIKEFLDTLSYPLYFLDFETFQQAIPQWDHVRPYMQIPFQYSLHIVGTRGAAPGHKEFLGKEGSDPRRELAESLCEDIPSGVCTLAYNAGFEMKIIEDLAAIFPDLSEQLMYIYDGIKDLIVPFRQGFYYSKAMGGSNSIKSVLPAMFPDDPVLDYSKLSLIHHGGDAMDAFTTLHEKPPEEIAEIRAALLAYCQLDTLAMVKILERLYSLVE